MADSSTGKTNPPVLDPEKAGKGKESRRIR
jgi:hypothetical protein